MERLLTRLRRQVGDIYTQKKGVAGDATPKPPQEDGGVFRVWSCDSIVLIDSSAERFEALGSVTRQLLRTT